MRPCISIRGSVHPSVGSSVRLSDHRSETHFFPNSRNCLIPTLAMDTKWSGDTCMHTGTLTHAHTNARPTVGWNCMKSAHSIHRLKTLFHELGSEWMGERANERSGAREQSEQGAASKWVNGASELGNGGVKSPVHDASTSYAFYRMCIDCIGV